MTINLDRDDLEALVKGTSPNYKAFNNALVKKGGHFYSDQYSRTSWGSLRNLTDSELYELYKICKNSWIN